MPGAVFLESERIELRTVEPEDVGVIQKAHNDPKLRDGLLYHTPQDAGDVEGYVQGLANEDQQRSVDLLICPREEGEEPPVAGLVNLFDIVYGNAEVAAWVFQEYQKRQYGAEAIALVLDYAFDTRGLNHVHGQMTEYNDACRKMVENLGFSREGTYREHVYRRGEYHDAYIYGILAEEWRDYRDEWWAERAP